MSRRPANAKVSGVEVGAGVPEQPTGSVGDHEQDRGGQREQDHKEGAGDGEEARSQEPVIPQYVKELTQRAEEPMLPGPISKPTVSPKYDEHWRGKVNGMTFRLIVWRAYSFIPEHISLERLISQGSEPETWTAEVIPQ